MNGGRPLSPALAPASDVVVIVDVLSFSTCVDIAVSVGAEVFPYLWRDERAAGFAAEIGGVLAAPRGQPGLSLSPASFHGLGGTLSPEAEEACHAFRACAGDLPRVLRDCTSGQELAERGFAADVALAVELDVSDAVPILRDRAYRRLDPSEMQWKRP